MKRIRFDMTQRVRHLKYSPELTFIPVTAFKEHDEFVEKLERMEEALDDMEELERPGYDLPGEIETKLDLEREEYGLPPQVVEVDPKERHPAVAAKILADLSSYNWSPIDPSVTNEFSGVKPKRKKHTPKKEKPSDDLKKMPIRYR